MREYLLMFMKGLLVAIVAGAAIRAQGPAQADAAQARSAYGATPNQKCAMLDECARYNCISGPSFILRCCPSKKEKDGCHQDTNRMPCGTGTNCGGLHGGTYDCTLEC